MFSARDLLRQAAVEGLEYSLSQAHRALQTLAAARELVRLQHGWYSLEAVDPDVPTPTVDGATYGFSTVHEALLGPLRPR